MKTLLIALVAAAFALPFAACTEVHRSTSSKTNWDGSKTYESTTVREGPGGTVSVDQEKTRVR